MTSTHHAELEEWRGSLDDRDELDRFFDEHGYLLLRDVFPVPIVEEIRDGVVRGLTDNGATVRDLATAEIDVPDVVDAAALHRHTDYRALWSDSRVLELMNHLFGEPVFTWRFVVLRAKAPGPDEYRAVPHQDAFFYEREPRFRTFWSPLAPVDPTMGGLAVVPGSHRGGLRESTGSGSKMANVGRGAFRTVAADQLPSAGWATPGSIRPGDLLVQHPHLVHEGLPNGSGRGRVRLSMDWRVQPASDFRTAASLHPLPELQARVEAGEMYIDDNGRYQFGDGHEPAPDTTADRAPAT